MQAVRLSGCQVALQPLRRTNTANETLEEKAEKAGNDQKCLSNNSKWSHVWTDNEAKLLLNITPEYKVNKCKKMPPDASLPHCNGRVDVHLSKPM